MPNILSDAEIAEMLAEPKRIRMRQFNILRRVAKQTDKRKRTRAVAELRGKSGRKYRLLVSINTRKTNGFSIILVYVKRKRGTNLIRCNGHQGWHTNFLEKKSRRGVMCVPPNTFHVHRLTERYQQADRGEHYAEPSTEFFCSASALDYMCNRFCISELSGNKKYQPLLE